MRLFAKVLAGAVAFSIVSAVLWVEGPRLKRRLRGFAVWRYCVPYADTASAIIDPRFLDGDLRNAAINQVIEDVGVLGCMFTSPVEYAEQKKEEIRRDMEDRRLRDQERWAEYRKRQAEGEQQ